MVRLSTPLETATLLALAGDGRARPRAPRRTSRCAGSGRSRACCSSAATRARGALVERGRPRGRLRSSGATAGSASAGSLGRPGSADRFRAPYLRNALWDAGYAVDTLETAVDWTRLPDCSPRPSAGRSATALDGPTASASTRSATCRTSTRAGSSLYATYVFRLAADPDETLDRWRRLKTRGRARRSSPHGGDDQPPARRRARPRAVPGGREGRARAWRCSATSRGRFDPGRAA